MKHLFGPVPSRRLGMSLGIDLVPSKVCTLNCIYCECGETNNLTISRKEYIKYEAIVKELEEYFKNNPDPDYFTFSGSGEPTLNSCIGKVLNFIKTERPNVPIAVLTNGTLLHRKKVRSELLSADLVLPSLDAATLNAFQKINLPHEKLSIEKHIQGLIDFRREFKGQIWLEAFILPSYNDDEENLRKMKEILIQISPDKIQLNTLDRPGCISNIRSATESELLKIIDLWNIPKVEIVSSVLSRKKPIAYRKDIKNTILETIKRRPCTINDLAEILNLRIAEVNKYLRILEQEKYIESLKQERGMFFRVIK